MHLSFESRILSGKNMNVHELQVSPNAHNMFCGMQNDTPSNRHKYRFSFSFLCTSPKSITWRWHSTRTCPVTTRHVERKKTQVFVIVDHLLQYDATLSSCGPPHPHAEWSMWNCMDCHLRTAFKDRPGIFLCSFFSALLKHTRLLALLT